MRAVNPRDVALVFVKYAKSIHKKVHRDDPNMLKLSIACGKVRISFADSETLSVQIEQWTEHHYPSFLQISGSAGSKPQTTIDQSSSDARAKLYMAMMDQAKAEAETERRKAFMADLRARGIIKDRPTNPDGTVAAPEVIPEMDDKFPWLMVLGFVGGLIGIFAVLSGLIIYIVLRFSKVGPPTMQ